MIRPRATSAAAVLLAAVSAHAAPIPIDLITDHSGGSMAVGANAVKWGFMCSIFARRGDRLCAITFTRPLGEPWDERTPNEAPVAFWSRSKDGRWRSTLLDGPKRTYQTPTLLLGPDGRANVFTLYPGDTTIYWFQERKAGTSDFERRAIAIPWGAYMGGAMDGQGRVLLAYWGTSKPGPDAIRYENGAVGWTLVDTRTGKSQSGLADAPGVPYCYPQVAFDRTGASILTVRSEVKPDLLVGSHNHYIELRYYHSPDPASKAPWTRVTLYHNDHGLVQPLGCVTDRAGRVHVLYNYWVDEGGGHFIPPTLVYAVSRDPLAAVSSPVIGRAAPEGRRAGVAPDFVKHVLKSGGWDGRLFRTRDGRIHVIAYKAGSSFEVATVLDGVAGRLTPWLRYETPVPFCRIFPLHWAGRGSVTDRLEGVLIGQPGAVDQSSVYAFTVPAPAR